MAERAKHPSGRPIRNERQKGRPLWRIPDDGYVTPSLRKRELTPAIGFTSQPYESKTDDED